MVHDWSLARRGLMGGMILLLIGVMAAYEWHALAAPSPLFRPLGQPGESVNLAFSRSEEEFQVPAPLLKAICYLEGRMSNNGGRPSVDNGYGCMHLTRNPHGDRVAQAASELGVSVNLLQSDQALNIRGGAAVLRDEALTLSPFHRLPSSLADWYGAVAAYSGSASRDTSLLYANAVYSLLARGFSAVADDGELVVQPAQKVQPAVASAAEVKTSPLLPSGCTQDKNVDYPQALDCLNPAQTFDCNQTPDKAPCNYETAQRPTDLPIYQIIIHDIEGIAQSSLAVFQNVKNNSSAHYIVDSDGTIFQVVREKDTAFHGGNYWYNEHSIGIEHAGIDATGYRWYNATEYLASAKLVAYLLQKYHLPLSHELIMSHGTIPSPSATNQPNHVDPGPYWLWDYYLRLIHNQGIPYPGKSSSTNIFTLHPATARQPFGAQGQETTGNFNFFYLYNGPSTASGRITQPGHEQDIADVSANVEPDVSYYYLDKKVDQAGTGLMMYQIWYGTLDHPAKDGSHFAHARLVWLAVPRSAVAQGQGQPIVLHADATGQPPQIYGEPNSVGSFVIGDAPDGSVFASTYEVTEDQPAPTTPKQDDNSTEETGVNGIQSVGGDQASGDLHQSGKLNQVKASGVSRRADGGPGSLWYEINYNHRQGWVPASEVTLT